MKIALLGGTGRIGSHVLTWALQNGHEVTALARTAGSIAPAAGLTIISGQATDRDAVVDVISGADAVVSALGPRGARTPALLATAAGHIVSAMDKAGTRRLVAVSAAGAFIKADPDIGAVVKLVLPRIFAKQFADVRQMESVIGASDLDWTLVRPSRLVDSAGTGRYRVRPDYPPPGGRKIARSDVAHFIAGALTEKSWVGSRPALAY
jgi:putative NADH-flavin reductase